MSLSHRASPLSRIVFGYVTIIGLLMVFGVNVAGLIGLPALLLVLIGAFSLMVRGRFPHHFWLMLVGLIVGPTLFCCMFGTIASLLHNLFAQTPGSYALILILPVLVILSFLYVRRRQNQNSPEHKTDLHTNERQPLPPVVDGESEIHQCAESNFSNESSSDASSATRSEV